jgi:hypothetical protein
MAEIVGKKGHRVVIRGLEKAKGHLTAEIIHDFIDMIYRWKDADFNIHIFTNASEMRKHWGDPRIKGTLLGEHRGSSMTNTHHISLVHDNIVKNLKRDVFPAGNNFKAHTTTMGYVMVLVHELTHANQREHHYDDSQFFQKKGYWNRACEREARGTVDDRINEICVYLNEEPPRRHKKKVDDDSEEVEAVVDILCECEEITMDDIRDELRASKILNPKNVQMVIEKINQRAVSTEELS